MAEASERIGVKSEAVELGFGLGVEADHVGFMAVISYMQGTLLSAFHGNPRR